MEEKEIKLSDFDEDFADFEDDGKMPQELYDEMAAEEEFENPTPSEIEEVAQEEVEQPIEEAQEEVQEVVQEEKKEEIEVSPWEELSKDNSVVKKYIFYVSKDLVPYVDNLTTDERNEFINAAIQLKIDSEDENKKKQLKNKVIFHFIIMILTICLSAPFVLMGVHKAIMLTFENYKYSQENFEKLYKQRFQKDRAYMRSIQYNKEQELKKQNKDK
ncbi:MAG: hypothetical protein IJW73_04010 [Candidatus Gastranaerophilales bacterium]|nr:hypothetical protein [Candidatus Gastranaerophilales bacterium]